MCGVLFNSIQKNIGTEACQPATKYHTCGSVFVYACGVENFRWTKLILNNCCMLLNLILRKCGVGTHIQQTQLRTYTKTLTNSLY